MRRQKMAPHVKNFLEYFFKNSYWEFKIQKQKTLKVIKKTI